MIVEDKTGYKNLCKIITRNCLNPLRYSVLNPAGCLSGKTSSDKMDIDYIAENHAGLIFISPEEKQLDSLRTKGIPDKNLFIRLDPENLYKTSRFRPCATTEVLYLKKSDFGFYKVLEAIKNASYIRKAKEKSNYLLTLHELSSLFAHNIDAIRNTLEIGERCNFRLKRERYIFPKADYSTLLKIVQSQQNRLDENVKQRLNYELQLIDKMDFSGLFLIAYTIGKFAREKDITINVRGSSNSSLVLHLMGLSVTNPLRFNLPFERFLNEVRSEPPDIDIDVEFHRRDEVMRFLFEEYGSQNTAQIATINHFRRRSSFRETCLAFGVSPGELKQIDLNRNEDLIKKIRNYASRIASLPNHVSVHIGGIVITPTRIDEFVPLCQSDKSIITHYDKDGIDYIGLVKLDILGVRGFPAIANLIHSPPAQDNTVFDLIGEGKTLGCFQIESPAMRSLLVRIKPRRIEDIAFSLALIRPGAADSGMKAEYLKQYEQDQIVRYFPDSILPLLEDTGGVPVYQEQILEIASAFAGFSLGEADKLRRAVSKQRSQETMNALRESFIKGAKQRAHSDEEIERVWQKISDFAGFGFNKAHSIAYGALAYLSAYTKKYNTTRFFASVISNHGGYYPTRAYVEEARRWGIKIRPPDVNLSQAAFKVLNGGIITGLAEIKNLSRRSISHIINHQPYPSLEQFFARVQPDIEEGVSLIKAGALDSFGLHRSLQFLLLLTHFKNRRHASQYNIVEQENLLKSLSMANKALGAPQLFADQFETLNFSPNFHPLKIIKPDRNLFIIDLKEGIPATIWGMIIVWRILRTKQGKLMAFISIDDETGLIETALFPEVYRKSKNIIGKFIGLTGYLKDYTFIVKEVLQDPCS